MPNYGYSSSQYSATQATSRPPRRPGPNAVVAARKLGIGTALPKQKKKEKVTMIDWLRNKIRNFIYPQDIESNDVIRADHDQIEESNTLRFTVTPARGGVIVQVRKYDRKNDDNLYVTHVIHDDENIGESIAHIVSMELLRS